MRKILDFFIIKKGDKLIFYKIFAWIIVILSVCSIGDTLVDKVKETIEESNKEEFVFKVDSIHSTDTSLEMDIKTNLPNHTRVNVGANPVGDFSKLGFPEDYLNLHGHGEVRDGKVHIKFESSYLKKAKDFVICKIPYNITASVYSKNSSEESLEDFEQKYKENEKVKFNYDSNSIDINLGKFDMKNGVTLEDYKNYWKKEYSETEVEKFKEYLAKYSFDDVSKVGYNNPNYDSIYTNRIIAEGTIIDIQEDNIGLDSQSVHIFIKLDNGEVIDLQKSKNELKGVYEDGKTINAINMKDLKKGDSIKAYGYGLRTSGHAYMNGEYQPINKTVVNTGVNTYDTYDCANMGVEYIEFIEKSNSSNQVQSTEHGEDSESSEGGSMYHRELYESAKTDLMSIYDTRLMNDFLNNNLNIEYIYDYQRELNEFKNTSTSWADTLWAERNCDIKVDANKEKEERLYISKIVSSVEPTLLTVDHYNDGYEAITEEQVLSELRSTMGTVNTNLNKIKNINFIN
ncbi:MAG: hypothetical protein RR942_15780 [Romboutsia sp.]